MADYDIISKLPNILLTIISSLPNITSSRSHSGCTVDVETGEEVEGRIRRADIPAQLQRCNGANVVTGAETGENHMRMIAS